MKERVTDFKLKVKETCYKETKFKTDEEKRCPFGFNEIKQDCVNCIWYKKDTIEILRNDE